MKIYVDNFIRYSATAIVYNQYTIAYLEILHYLEIFQVDGIKSEIDAIAN